MTRVASSSSGQRRLAVHRERGRDRGGVVILRAEEARGPPRGRVGPGRCRNPPGGGGSRSTRREGGLGRRRDHPGGGGMRSTGRGCERGGVILRPPGRGGSRSTVREGGTGEALSFSGRRRLAVHREGARGWHRRRRHSPGGGGSRSTWREGRLAVHREGGWDRGGVVIIRAEEARVPPAGMAGQGRRHPPGGGGTRFSGREGGTWQAWSSSGRRSLAVHRERGRDRGGVILREAEARGPPRGRAEPGRFRHPPGGGGSRSTGRKGGTGEVTSSGTQRLAVHREGGCDRVGVVILLAAEARGPPGKRVGPRRCRYPPGGRGSRSTGREGGTGEAWSSSGVRRLAVHREGGWVGEASSSSWRRRLAVYRERGCDRGGVILRAAEARGPPGRREGPGRRRHPPGGGGSRSTGREGGTGEASSSSGRRRLAVHREGGWDRGGVVIFRAAEARGPPGVRAGPGRHRHRPGGVRHAVHREGGQDRGGVVILPAAEARGLPGGRVGPGRRRHLSRRGSRSTGREGVTEEVSSSGRRRLAVNREGGRDRGGVVILRAEEARGRPGGSSRVGPGRRRHSPGGGCSRSTGREGRVAVHREGGWDRGGVVILRAAEAHGRAGEGAGPGRRHPPG